MSKATELKQKINESKDKKQSKLGQLNERLEKAIEDIKIRGGVISEGFRFDKVKEKFQVVEVDKKIYAIIWKGSKVYKVSGLEKENNQDFYDFFKYNLLSEWDGFEPENCAKDYEVKEDGKEFLNKNKDKLKIIANNGGIVWDNLSPLSKEKFKLLK